MSGGGYHVFNVGRKQGSFIPLMQRLIHGECHIRVSIVMILIIVIIMITYIESYSDCLTSSFSYCHLNSHQSQYFPAC